MNPTIDQVHDSSTFISTIHSDVIQTHILTHLDGPTLASVASVSSQLNSLSADDNLWRNISTATWPSIKNSAISDIISTFPAGHRSFFADSYPFPDRRSSGKVVTPVSSPPPVTEKLISAVDVYYKDDVIYSAARETETVTPEFLSSNFQLDLLELQDSIPTKVRHDKDDDTWMIHLKENLKLSWIIIDPTRKRAINVSSRNPVLVKQHWMEDRVELRFATILAGDEEEKSTSKEFVLCGVEVTCVKDEDGQVHVRGVRIHVEDMNRVGLNGKECLVILERAMEKCGRKKGGSWEERKKEYGEFLVIRKERKEKLENREKRLEKVCKTLDIVCVLSGLAVFVSFWSSSF